MTINGTPITGTEAAIIVALIAAVGSIAASWIGVHNAAKLNIIHVLVNSNLTEIKNKLEVTLAQKATAETEIQRLRDNAAEQHDKADHPDITNK